MRCNAEQMESTDHVLWRFAMSWGTAYRCILSHINLPGTVSRVRNLGMESQRPNCNFRLLLLACMTRIFWLQGADFYSERSAPTS